MILLRDAICWWKLNAQYCGIFLFHGSDKLMFMDRQNITCTYITHTGSMGCNVIV